MLHKIYKILVVNLEDINQISLTTQLFAQLFIASFNDAEYKFFAVIG